MRRITIELYQATRDGETTLYLLTNLPAAVSALLIADGYGNRWLIETAFQELTVDLACEVQTLGYPKAALFAFCVATMCYNAFSVAKAALRVKQAEVAASPANPPSQATSAIPPQPPADPSTYYLADEVAGTWRGMMVVLPESFWEKKFADLTPASLADALRGLADRADLTKYRKRSSTKKRYSGKPSCPPGSPHVSTARILNGNMKPKCKC